MNDLKPFKTSIMIGEEELDVQVYASYHKGSGAADDPSDITLNKVQIDDPNSFRNNEDVLEKIDEDTVDDLRNEALEQAEKESDRGDPHEDEED